MKGLIVTADDFGAAIEVNDAVEDAYRNGILTCASLMVAGSAAYDAVERAKRMPSLRVGLHLTLLEGNPVLPPSEIPELLGTDGQFRTDMKRLSLATFTRPSVRQQMSAEIAAQFEAFRTTGLPLDHVNAHKHFHLHPTIAGLILRVGRSYGVRGLRVPYEPRNVLRRAAPGETVDFALDTLPWSILLRKRAHRAGMLVPDCVFGLRWSGAMTRARLSGLIEHLPDGLSEIYLHPATSPYTGSASGYCYGAELDALCDEGIRAQVQRLSIRRGGMRAR